MDIIPETEYRFFLVYSDPSVHGVPGSARVTGRDLNEAVQKFALAHGLIIDTVEADAVWYVHTRAGTVHGGVVTPRENVLN